MPSSVSSLTQTSAEKSVLKLIINIKLPKVAIEDPAFVGAKEGPPGEDIFGDFRRCLNVRCCADYLLSFDTESQHKGCSKVACWCKKHIKGSGGLAALCQFNRLVSQNGTSKAKLQQRLNNACYSHNIESRTRRNNRNSSINAHFYNALVNGNLDAYFFSVIADNPKVEKPVSRNTGQSFVQTIFVNQQGLK